MSPKTEKIDIRAFTEAPAPLKTGNYFYDNAKQSLIIFMLGFVLIFLLSSTFKPIILMLYIWIGLGIFYLQRINKLGNQRMAAIMQKFVTDNGFTLSDERKYVSDGVIFGIGNNDHSTENIIRGTLYGYPFALYWHRFSVGSGKSRTTQFYGVAEIDLPKQVPRIFLDSKYNNFLSSDALDIFQRQDVLELEGDFSKHFRLYAAKDYQIAVLTILNPGFMQALIDQPDKYEIELTNQKAYIYCRNEITASETSVVRLFTAAEFLVLQLQKQLDTFNFVTDAASPNQLQVSRLKKIFRN